MKKAMTSIIFTIVLFISCNKSKEEPPYVCVSCTKNPQALAANNSSSKGIYKGVFFGSTGTISFDIQNNSTAVTAALIIDGVTVSFSSGTIPLTGQPYTATFAGTINGQPANINFSVQADGSAPVITAASIPGHPNVVFDLLKETSVNLVECFEGTSKGQTTIPESGKVNLVLSRSAGTWNALTTDDRNNPPQPQQWNGTISGNSLSCSCPQGVIISGTFSGDQINGQYSDNTPVTGGGSGTWTVRRTF